MDTGPWSGQEADGAATRNADRGQLRVHANRRRIEPAADVGRRHGADAENRDGQNAAALKPVPSCEFLPIKAVRTNALGAECPLDAAIGAGVQRVIVLSTDKAVYPINAMGISKAMMEKLAVANSRVAGNTL